MRDVGETRYGFSKVLDALAVDLEHELDDLRRDPKLS